MFVFAQASVLISFALLLFQFFKNIFCKLMDFKIENKTIIKSFFRYNFCWDFANLFFHCDFAYFLIMVFFVTIFCSCFFHLSISNCNCEFFLDNIHSKQTHETTTNNAIHPQITYTGRDNIINQVILNLVETLNLIVLRAICFFVSV